MTSRLSIFRSTQDANYSFMILSRRSTIIFMTRINASESGYTGLKLVEYSPHLAALKVGCVGSSLPSPSTSAHNRIDKVQDIARILVSFDLLVYRNLPSRSLAVKRGMQSPTLCPNGSAVVSETHRYCVKAGSRIPVYEVARM